MPGHEQQQALCHALLSLVAPYPGERLPGFEGLEERHAPPWRALAIGLKRAA